MQRAPGPSSRPGRPTTPQARAQGRGDVGIDARVDSGLDDKASRSARTATARVHGCKTARGWRPRYRSRAMCRRRGGDSIAAVRLTAVVAATEVAAWPWKAARRWNAARRRGARQVRRHRDGRAMRARPVWRWECAGDSGSVTGSSTSAGRPASRVGCDGLGVTAARRGRLWRLGPGSAPRKPSRPLRRSSAANGFARTPSDPRRAARSAPRRSLMPDIRTTGVPPSRGWSSRTRRI